MKPLRKYIQEKLVIKKRNNIFDYKYFPETKEELKNIIRERIKTEGNNVDLNDINTSKITDMSFLFDSFDFNGNISEWDVSKVTNMKGMFFECKNFNQDISTWDVSNVTNMNSMFYECESFNQDISFWNISHVKDMRFMLSKCKSFNQDISNWDVSNVKYLRYLFLGCPIEEKYRPKSK